jgi:hypothetical protein
MINMKWHPKCKSFCLSCESMTESNKDLCKICKCNKGKLLKEAGFNRNLG